MRRTRIPIEIARLVRQDANQRCGYCLSEESLTGLPLSFEHILPLAAGGLTTRENMWLAFRACNEYKNDRTHAIDPNSGQPVPIFNPRFQRWNDHFQLNSDSTIILGLTPTGRATIAALQLNRMMLVRARLRWTIVGWPSDTQ